MIYFHLLKPFKLKQTSTIYKVVILKIKDIIGVILHVLI